MSEKEEEVYSAKLPAGERMYFFDIRESAAGGRYLAITETRSVGNDASELQHVIVYPEDALAFNEEIGKALRWVFSDVGLCSRPKSSQRKKEIRNSHGWTEEEESALRKEYLRVGTRPTIEELAGLLHKKPSQIRAKLQEMRLL